jgi:hypothetical protein
MGDAHTSPTLKISKYYARNWRTRVAEKKSQHYVPQFYLRNFSIGEKCIGLFNLRSSKIVPQAGIKDQACGDYFYGRDLFLENRLMKLEGEVSRIFRNIKERRLLPARGSHDQRTLCLYVMFQDSRTTASLAKQNEMTEKLGKAMLSRSIKDPELLKHLPDLKIEVNHPFVTLFKQAITLEPIIRDLKLKVLHNVSRVPFVTSDHPIVMQNQFYPNFSDNRSRGLASEGLQILLPISAHYMLMFYDGSVYEAGSIASNFIRIPSDEQIGLLNGHQWIDAVQNVFFPEGADMANIERQASRYVPMRRTARVDFKITPLEQVGSRRSELFEISENSSHIAPLIACKHRTMPTSISDKTQFPLRQPEWIKQVINLRKLLEGGNLSFDEFWLGTENVPTSRKRA